MEKKKEAEKIRLKEQKSSTKNQLAFLGKGQAKIAADLWHAVTTHRTVQVMLLFLVFALFFWNVEPISTVLYPFKLFVTIIHEACHALAARLTGGNVAFISISPDESGLTGSMGGFAPLVIQAGYIGTAIFGGLLIWWGKQPAAARTVLQTIGTVILALTVFYGGGPSGGIFAFIAMALIGIAILVVARKGSELFCHLFLLMLAVMTTMEAVISIQDLFLISALSSGASDARNMEHISGVPAIIWSVLWGIIAVAILVFSLWFSYKPDNKGNKKDLLGTEME